MRVRTNIDFSYYFHRNGPWGMNGDLWGLEIQNRVNVDSLHLLKRSSADLGASTHFILHTFTVMSIRRPPKTEGTDSGSNNSKVNFIVAFVNILTK